MVDRNNLNRIKGILSAQQGAEIPKYEGGAKFAMYGNKQTIYSADRSKWFLDAGLSQAYTGSLAGFKSIQLPTQPIRNTIAIPGQPEITPTTAIENSAEIIAETEEKKKEEVAAARATLEPLPKPEEFKHKLDIPQTASVLNVEDPIKTQALNIRKEELAKLEQQEVQLQKYSNIADASSQAIQAIGGVFKAHQATTDSSLTKGADAAYNTIADVAGNFGPIGKAVKTGMQVFGAAGDVIQGLGGGTDQQTTTDKWMDSAFFSWNIGMLNGFAGKNSDSFGIDQDTVAQVGSSYGGTVDDLNDAASKADKKYGLFSSKARKKANAAIASAKTSQNLMGSIANDASDQRLAVQSMGEQAGLAYSIMTSGGYDQKYTYAAKQGGTIDWNPTITIEWEPQIELNWELPEFKEGGNVILVENLEKVKEDKPSFEEWFNSIPEHFRAPGYDYKKAYEVFDWEELRKHAEDPDKNHLRSASPIADEEGKYPFLKLGLLEENPELQGEFDWYNSEDGKEHKSKFDIKYIGDRYYYVPKKFKEGGKTQELDVPETEETTQKNVIPEGALHKNKHHMEHAEGLTKKGIPVIDEDGEQQAEIEHSEIIFTLEVTKKLEEYYDIFYSDDSTNKEKEQAALEAGKLLVFQILENTEDRTGLIDSCKKGGSLTLKKSTDDLIEEVLEWIPSITIVIDSEEKEKPINKDKKPEVKSEKEVMKEAIKEVLIELLTK